MPCWVGASGRQPSWCKQRAPAASGRGGRPPFGPCVRRSARMHGCNAAHPCNAVTPVERGLVCALCCCCCCCCYCFGSPSAAGAKRWVRGGGSRRWRKHALAALPLPMRFKTACCMVCRSRFSRSAALPIAQPCSMACTLASATGHNMLHGHSQGPQGSRVVRAVVLFVLRRNPDPGLLSTYAVRTTCILPSSCNLPHTSIVYLDTPHGRPATPTPPTCTHTQGTRPTCVLEGCGVISAVA